MVVVVVAREPDEVLGDVGRRLAPESVAERLGAFLATRGAGRRGDPLVPFGEVEGLVEVIGDRSAFRASGLDSANRLRSRLDWALPTDPRDARIARVQAHVEEGLRRPAMLDAEVARLQLENVELRARLDTNSLNSSTQPSADGRGVKRPETKPTGRERGGQPGHSGAKRQLLPADRIVHYRPRRCRRSDRELRGDDPKAKRLQVWELPEFRPHVTEHRAHALTCAGVAAVTSGVLPAAERRHGFGTSLSGFVAYVTAYCRLSKWQVVERCEDALGAPISLGAVSAIEQDESEALAAPFEEAAAAVQEQPAAHIDETERKRLAWRWVAVTTSVVVFRVARSRCSAAAKDLLRTSFRGRTSSGRWGADCWLEPARRELC